MGKSKAKGSSSPMEEQGAEQADKLTPEALTDSVPHALQITLDKILGSYR